jgi:Zn-dependent membrane protease YugP
MTVEICHVLLLFLGISLVVFSIPKNKFTRYRNIPFAKGFQSEGNNWKNTSGKGIYDADMTSVDGFISGHYYPVNTTVNLCPDGYNSANVSPATVSRLFSILLLRTIDIQR